MSDIFLLFSITLLLVSVIPYIRDILRGTTKPNIVSWSTWTLLTGIATVAEFAAGETTTAIFTLAATLETLAIVVLGLRYGFARYSGFDTLCQLGAIIGLMLWWIYDSPTIAVVAAVAIDAVGALPTLRHAWQNPQEETWSTFALASAGAAMALLALSSYTWASVSYPIYLLVADGIVAGIILYRIHALQHHQLIKQTIPRG